MTYKKICPACNGMGVIKRLTPNITTATYSEIATCSKCGGEGWIDKKGGLDKSSLYCK